MSQFDTVPEYMKMRAVYDVSYHFAAPPDALWGGERDPRYITADFTLDQAKRMVGVLLDGKWGEVSSVTVTKTERLCDTRTTQEIESQVIS